MGVALVVIAVAVAIAVIAVVGIVRRFGIADDRVIGTLLPGGDGVDRDGQHIDVGAGLDIGAGAHPRPEREMPGMFGIDEILIRIRRKPDMHFVIGDVIGGYRRRRTACSRHTAGDLRYDPTKFSVIVSIYFDQGRVAKLYLGNIVLADVDDRLYLAHIGDPHHLRAGHHGVADHAFPFLDAEERYHPVDRRDDGRAAEIFGGNVQIGFGTRHPGDIALHVLERRLIIGLRR